jgi:hypothetical protein
VPQQPIQVPRFQRPVRPSQPSFWVQRDCRVICAGQVGFCENECERWDSKYRSQRLFSREMELRSLRR